MRPIAVEYWDVKCVDEFEKYHKQLTEEEIKELTKIRNKIFNLRTPKYQIEDLYRDAIEILHNAWTRTMFAKKFTFRQRREDEDGIEESIGYFGVSEAWK
jgi:hypothetical protein